MGNTTRDIELRYTPQGTAVTDLGLAINRQWTDDNGQKQEDVTFVSVTLWARQAEVAGQYLKKGDPVFVEGRLQYSTWEKDGQKHSKLSVVGERLQLLGSKPPKGGPSEGPPRSSRGAPAPAARGGQGIGGPEEPDDIPFTYDRD